jgi:hypothetical protein
MNSDDDDMELLSYLNTNNKLVKSETLENKQQQPPRKRIRIESENLENSANIDKSVEKSNLTEKMNVPALFNVVSVLKHDSFLELNLKEINKEGDAEAVGCSPSCYLYDSW